MSKNKYFIILQAYNAKFIPDKEVDAIEALQIVRTFTQSVNFGVEIVQRRYSNKTPIDEIINISELERQASK
jgi:hypothetical protein